MSEISMYIHNCSRIISENCPKNNRATSRTQRQIHVCVVSPDKQQTSTHAHCLCNTIQSSRVAFVATDDWEVFLSWCRCDLSKSQSFWLLLFWSADDCNCNTDSLVSCRCCAERCRASPLRLLTFYCYTSLLPSNPRPRERKICYAASFSSSRAKGPGSQASLEPGPGKCGRWSDVTSKPCQACLTL